MPEKEVQRGSERTPTARVTSSGEDDYNDLPDLVDEGTYFCVYFGWYEGERPGLWIMAFLHVQKVP